MILLEARCKSPSYPKFQLKGDQKESKYLVNVLLLLCWVGETAPFYMHLVNIFEKVLVREDAVGFS